VYLVRHGQTQSNISSVYAGRSTEGLTATGREQVGRLAQILQYEQLAEIRCSGIQRAVETGGILSECLQLSLTVDPRLDEMRLGPWEGLTENEVACTFPQEYSLWLSRPDLLELEGRETLSSLAVRTMDAVREAVFFPRPIALVTHVALIRLAILSTLRRPFRLYKRIDVPTASCFRLDLGHGQVTRYPDRIPISLGATEDGLGIGARGQTG
jgi:probable phosphoglycerate mutase